MTGSKPEEQPNEPKINPQGASMGKQNMKVKPPSQTSHISVPIDKVHIFGKKVEDKVPMHTDPKGASTLKKASGLNPRLPKPKA